jgi:hypothetical protein
MNPELVFRRELVLSNCREDVIVEKVLSCENRLGSTVPFCLFDRVLNVISIKDIDDNGCKLKTRDLIFLQNQVPKFISSGENIIRFLGDYIAKHIRQNSSLQEGQ